MNKYSLLLSKGGLSLDRLHNFCLITEAGGLTKAAEGNPAKLSLFSRFRTEERFFATTSKKDKNFALRLRYRMAVVQTLSDKWKIQLANEYMRQVAGGEFTFQQNRLGAAATYSVNSTTQLQAGYIWSKLARVTQHFITCTFTKTIITNEHRHKG